jgi:hypothetical protein
MSMTHSPPSAAFAPAVADDNVDFAVERSRWLDTFAQAETIVCRALLKFSSGDNKSSFCQRLKDLAALKPSPSLSKDSASFLQSLPAEMDRYLRIRAAMVHSSLNIGQQNGRPAALFQNVSDAARDTPIFLVMTMEDFNSSRVGLDRIADRLAGVVSPSSPPPPAQAAAAGP